MLRLRTGAAAPKDQALSGFHAASTLALRGTRVLKVQQEGALGQVKSRDVAGTGIGAERQLAP